MKYQSDYDRGFKAEERFAEAHLQNITWASKEQDMFEHWDVKGFFNGKEYKFDVKGLKKINRSDNDFQDNVTWVEGVNVIGNKGWLQGEADYIVFERVNEWWIIARNFLFDWTTQQLVRNGYKKGKALYSLYQRNGRKDKITLIAYNDIPEIHIIKKPITKT